MQPAGSLGTGFDLNSQSGVMAVLVAVRQSTLTPAQKGELRDLVFLYTNGGGDVTVRRSLEQKITTYGLVPVAPVAKVGVVKPPPAPVRPYGVTRPAPQFAPVSATTTLPSPALIKLVVESPVIPAPEPKSVVEPMVVAPAPEPVVVLSESPLPTSVPTPAETTTAVPTPQVVPIPVPTNTGTNVDSALARIREIKSAVNQKVGNPVNLVDINNTVGREYMVALLEAMKQVAGNVSGDLSATMARLEAAYAAVEIAISNHAASVGESSVRPEVGLSPMATATVSAPTPQTMSVPTEVPPLPPQQPVYVPVTPPPVASAEWSAPEPVPDNQPEVPSYTPPPATPSARFTSVAEETIPIASIKSYRAASLAEDPLRVQTPRDLPDAASITTSSVTGDPLFTKEIDAGLQQLLSEWVIFKKSGLFGTGPNGREHPLFKTLASVTIPIILAGRFDGATQEIRQSITDYMNGWRYEQGIIYEQSETFEHYLRRVIGHIIELQKRRHQA